MLNTMKAAGKRTAETRSTFERRERESRCPVKIAVRSLTNCALSRTGLAALVIGAGWDMMICGVGHACVGDGIFVLDMDEY